MSLAICHAPLSQDKPRFTAMRPSPFLKGLTVVILESVPHWRPAERHPEGRFKTELERVQVIPPSHCLSQVSILHVKFHSPPSHCLSQSLESTDSSVTIQTHRSD